MSMIIIQYADPSLQFSALVHEAQHVTALMHSKIYKKKLHVGPN